MRQAGGQTIIPGAEPFYVKGDDVGCLMIHGFTGTPNEVRWLGERLAAGGRTVLGVRLDGHGTSPEDMNETRWPDWYESAVAGYRQLRGECEQVFAMGLSMGGMLALLLAAWESVDGVVAMATPAHIRNWRIGVLRPFQRFIPYWPQLPSDMQDKAMAAEHIQYERMPTACILSLLDLAKVMRKQLPRVQCPTLLVYSRQDQIVPLANMRFIHAHLAARDKRMATLERGGHCVCEDVEREAVLARVREFIVAHQTKAIMRQAHV